MADASYVDYNPAFKLSISDIISLQKGDNGWTIVFGKDDEPRAVHQFQIQVEILQLSGFKNEIMIVSDATGKAKIKRSACVPGDFSWVKIGSWCSIIGSLLENGKLPQIDVIKMAIVDNPMQMQIWPLEVQELRNFLSKKTYPRIETSNPC